MIHIAIRSVHDLLIHVENSTLLEVARSIQNGNSDDQIVIAIRAYRCFRF